MQLQELCKNAIIDSGMLDYAEDVIPPELYKQAETLAFQTVNSLNNDPAIAFGLDEIVIDNLTSPDIFFPLPPEEKPPIEPGEPEEPEEPEIDGVLMSETGQFLTTERSFLIRRESNG